MKLKRRTTKQDISLAAMMIFSLITTASAIAQAGENNFTLEPEFSVDSGDYGGGDTITTSTFSISGEYEFARAWTLSLTIVPYLHQDEMYTDVVLVAGRPVHHLDHSGGNPHHGDTQAHHRSSPDRYHLSVHESDHANSHHPGSHDPGHGDNHSQLQMKHRGGHGRHTILLKKRKDDDRAPSLQADGYPQTNSAGPAARQEAATQIEQEVRHHGSASGIGDTTFDLSYRIVDETASRPETNVHAGVKIPTADEEKGLGTGKPDYQAGVALNKVVGRWSLQGGVDYNILGKPDDYDLDNYLSGYGEVGIMVRPDMEVAMQFSGAQAASTESKGELALGLKLRYDMEQVGEFSAGLQKGLADGSPDYSAVVGYSISF